MKKASILVIDDEESIRFTMERFLTLKGYRVVLAGSCREARQQMSEGGIDLIITDIILPDGNGIDLLCEARQKLPGCPVIVITAYPSAETVRETLLMGAFDYLFKPVRQQEVLKSIKAALHHQKDIKATEKLNNHCCAMAQRKEMAEK